MIGVKATGGSPSLRSQVTRLQNQIVLRRQRMRSVAAGINQKINARMTSPGMLLAAVGVGVAVERTSRDRDGSLATVLDATYACIRLLLSFSSSMPQSTESKRREP